MCQITLNEDQVRKFNSSRDGIVELIDGESNLVWRFRRPTLSAQEIAEAEQRAGSEGPWYTTAEMLEHLNALMPSQ